MKKQNIFLLLGTLLFILFSGVKVSAAEMSFAVQAVIPENQIDKTQSYFDLKMQAGQSQDLTVEMRNDTSEAVTVNVLPNTATTNQNGIVEYNNTTNKKDNSLKVSFKDIATAEKEVTIPAKSQKQVKIHVQMPKDAYDGVVLGGIYFTEKSTDKKDDTSKGSQIVNRYAYVIGVKLTETDKVVDPELRLNNVKATQVNYRNVFTANIQNYEAAILKDLKIDGKIYRKGSDKVLYSASRDNLRMAPNSNFDYAISLDNKPFKPGKYTFKGVAKSGTKEWKFEKDFEIKGTTARSFNKNAVSLERDYTWVYLLIGFLLFMLLLIVIIILMIKLKAEKKEHQTDKKD